MLQNFLNNIVFLSAFIILSTFFSRAEGRQLTNLETPQIAVIYDSKDISSLEYDVQIEAALGYSNFPYYKIDIRKDSSLTFIEGTKLVINTTFSITNASIESIEGLVNFIASGGNFIQIGPITTEEFGFIQGLKTDISFDLGPTVKGIHLLERVFPGMKNKTYFGNTHVPHDGLIASNFNSKVRVIARAHTDPNYPVILENTIGFGTVLLFNTNILFEKQYRGLIFSAILRLMPNMPYRVANVGTMFLDDFPAPLYNEKLEPIKSEYDIDQADFVYSIWWPDMKAYADSVLMTYSAMTAFNYNANIVPPFDFKEWELARLKINGKEIKPSVELAKDIITTRHELAFHGYNHFSLNIEEWQNNQRFMVAALQSTLKRWRIDDLKKLPVTYVPPTNYIDSTGIQAIVKGMPSIINMSSLYLGDVPDGGGREFGPEPYNSKLYNYPRITSGFTMKENSLFDQHGMQLLTGVWNHFIHPDDIFQINQRSEDAFESRNPDSLGWRTTDGKQFGLFDLLKERIKHTKTQYPFTRLVAANFGAKVTRDWLKTSTKYSQNKENIIVQVIPPASLESDAKIKNQKHWFMYVAPNDKMRIEQFLTKNAEGYSFSKIWDGYLFQFYSEKNIFIIPRSSSENSADVASNRIIVSALRGMRQYQQVLTNLSEGLPEISPEQLLNNAISSYMKDPRNIKKQEKVIELSIENDQNIRAIQVLEFKLRSSPIWNEIDTQRLVTYYGYESETNRAINFLEMLWKKYENQQVITLKDSLANRLGIYEPEFVQRWRLREIQLMGPQIPLVLAYTSAIENPNTWPEVKSRLLGLIENNPNSDSLYAYTIRRSFYYEPPDSTIELLESFPHFSHSQLTEFATDFANIYGYTLFNYDQALYWAAKSTSIPKRSILDWIAQNNELEIFYAQSKVYLSQDKYADSLRSFAGTTLYYRGYKERGYEILYPLFYNGKSGINEADTLITEELKYLPYIDKKTLFSSYPHFFSDDEMISLRTENRWNEGVSSSVFGEYFSDNFNKKSARGGVSVQFGNRRNKTHTFKLEDVFVNSDVGVINISSNFTGLGYEFEKRADDFSNTLKIAPTIFYGDEGFLAEIKGTYSFSRDSSFTSLSLSFEPEYSQEAIARDIFKGKFEFYREDPWFDNLISTTLSGNTQLYTNNVIDYSLTGKVYVQPWDTKFRPRFIGELGWQDANKQFVNADPFFTQDKYFLKGAGVDLRYRMPNTFDYKTLLNFEVMGKHSATGGYYMTANANIEHKFKNFWQIKTGTDFSTSSVYQSNRFFITISHYFPTKFKFVKQ